MRGESKQHKRLSRQSWFLAVVIFSSLWNHSSSAYAQPDWMLRARVNGQDVEGVPLSWDSKVVQLLSRDGQLLTFPTARASDYSKVPGKFRGYSAGEIRNRLIAELGPRFDVTGTGHYLVAHSRGRQSRWPQRFEDIYRSFSHYFQVRGMRVRSPRFPLVAIVWKNKQEFMHAAAVQGVRISGNMLGFYSSDTNRVMLYESGSEGDETAWIQDAATIIHESAHQSAFNTGVHRRFADTPVWVVEGLGTLFEAPGVFDPRNFTRGQDRVNLQQLGAFRSTAVKRKEGFLVELISSDRTFRRDIQRGYAEAWALTYFLSETRPTQYVRYLKLTAQLPYFETYSPAKRLKDFTEVFGTDLKMLESHFLQTIKKL